MITGILIALVAAVANGLLAVIYEVCARRKYNIFEFILYAQFFGFLFGLALSIARGLSLADVNLLWLGLLASFTYLVAIYSYLMAARESDVGANWTILNLSLAIPVALSIIYFHDHLTINKGFGFVGVIASIIIIGGAASGRTASFSSKWVKWITLAFVANGCTLIIFRFVPKNEASLFTLYFYGLSFLLVLTRKLVVRGAPPKGLPLLSLASAAAQWTGVLLIIIALGILGSSSSDAGLIVYPITNGLVIPVGVLFAALLLGERLSRRRWVGVAVGVVSLICLAA